MEMEMEGMLALESSGDALVAGSDRGVLAAQVFLCQERTARRPFTLLRRERRSYRILLELASINEMPATN